MQGLKEEKKKTVTQNSLPTQSEKVERQTMHSKARILFPVARVLKKMKKGRYADRISSKSAVSVAAVLEYLTAEMIEMSGEFCLENEKKSNVIKPRHICLAVRKDEEMNAAIGANVIIPMGGVIPFIHDELQKKKKKSGIDKFKDDMAEEDESTEGEESEDEDN